MYWQSVRLFWGVGECFLLVSFDALYGCTADSEKHQAWLSCVHFLNWILKDVGVNWKVVRSSGVLVWIFKHTYCIFECCVIISIWIRQNQHLFLVTEGMFLWKWVCAIFCPQFQVVSFIGGVWCRVCNLPSIKPFFQWRLNGFQVPGTAETTIKMIDWLLNKLIISKVKQMPAFKWLCTANKEC